MSCSASARPYLLCTPVQFKHQVNQEVQKQLAEGSAELRNALWKVNKTHQHRCSLTHHYQVKYREAKVEQNEAARQTQVWFELAMIREGLNQFLLVRSSDEDERSVQGCYGKGASTTFPKFPLLTLY